MPDELTQIDAAQKPQTTSDAVFLSGSLALDLVNTEMIIRGKPRDALSSPDTLARWWQEACRQHPDSVAAQANSEPIAWNNELLNAVKALRLTLRTLSAHIVEHGAVENVDLEQINAILALGYSALEKTPQGAIQSLVHLRDPEKASVLFPIASSAARLFTESDWRRLHKCKNDRCILFFYDTTKSATRHWCSVGCMNRSRSIQHYRATKEQRV